jgi:hypothetical protein
MISLKRLMKLGYVLALGGAVFVLSKPQPVRAQRAIAYPFLPGAMTSALSMSILAGMSSPFSSYNMASQMLMQAGIPAGMSVGGGTTMSGGALGVGGGAAGMGGGMMGMGGGMMGMGGMGGMGGMMGMGGMGMGGMRGGFGGMGGFAGKGFGGFNGKKPL